MDFNLIIWNKDSYQEYLKYLVSLQDIKYLRFNKTLVTSKYEMIGIKLPILRGIAKKILKGDYISFLREVKHIFMEEIMVEGFVIAGLKTEEEFDKYFLKYIDYIDNWACSDAFCNSLVIVNSNPKKYFNICKKLTLKNNEFKVRVGLVTILYFFIDEVHIDTIYNILDNIKVDSYYVNMASAWLLCECMVKYDKKTINYLKVAKINTDVYKKALQKMRDSYRISVEDKEILKEFSI